MIPVGGGGKATAASAGTDDSGDDPPGAEGTDVASTDKPGDEPEETVDQKSEEKPAGREVPFFVIGAGFELGGRRFRPNSQDVTGLREYDAGAVPLVRLTGELNPLAFAHSKLASGWGVFASYGRATPLDSTAKLASGMEVNVPTVWTEIDLGLRYRYRFSAGTFLGAAFAGSTTFVDVDDAAGNVHRTIGVNAVWLGEIVGIDVDLAHSAGFFERDRSTLVASSGVTTLTGNIVVALPARRAEYGLRPYFVAGGGLLRVGIDHFSDVLPVRKTSPAIDVGGGVLGFITNRVGVCWELRRFGSLSRTTEEHGVSFGGEHLTFWRASMALAIRY
jgi:hypothetical protein